MSTRSGVCGGAGIGGSLPPTGQPSTRDRACRGSVDPVLRRRARRATRKECRAAQGRPGQRGEARDAAGGNRLVISLARSRGAAGLSGVRDVPRRLHGGRARADRGNGSGHDRIAARQEPPQSTRWRRRAPLVHARVGAAARSRSARRGPWAGSARCRKCAVFHRVDGARRSHASRASQQTMGAGGA